MKINYIYEILSSWDENKALSLFIYYFKNIAKTNDEIFSCISWISEIYMNKDDYKKAEEYLLIWYKLYKWNNFDILFNLGVVYLNLWDQKNSDIFINKAKAINPTDEKLVRFIDSFNKKTSNYENVYEFEDENWNKKVDIVYRINILCNQNCTFCNVVNKELVEEYKDLESVKKEISEALSIYKDLPKKDIQFILSWGEPTLNKNFWEIVDYVLKENESVLIQTNAVMFGDKTFIKWLENRKFEWIKFYVSFHSHIEKIYNTITRSTDYKNAIVGIANIQKYSEETLQFNFVFNKYNIWTFEGYVKFLIDTFSIDIWAPTYKKENYADDSSYIKNRRILSLNISSITWVKDNDNMVKYSDILNELYRAEKKLWEHISIAWLEPWWAMCDIPYCVYNRITDLNVDNKKLFIFDSIDSNNIKLDNCKSCKYDKNCPWISKAYLSKFWEEEFVFIK